MTDTHGDKSSESPPNGPTFLSCPFCGKAPDPTDRSTLHPSGTYWHFEAEIGCRAYHGLRERCDGDGECYVMTCLTEAGGCGARVSGDSEAEAVAAWNRRCARSAGTRIAEGEADFLRRVRDALAPWNGLNENSVIKALDMIGDRLVGFGAPQSATERIHDWQPDGGGLKFESHYGCEAPHVHTTCSNCHAKEWFTEHQWELLTKGCANEETSSHGKD